VKTLDRVRNVIDRFEAFTYCLVNGKSRDLELRNTVSIYDTHQDRNRPYPASSSQGILPRTLCQHYFCPLQRHPPVVKRRRWIGREDLTITVNGNTLGYNKNKMPRLPRLMYFPTCPSSHVSFYAELTAFGG
jgi:hypothetical protein